MKNCSMLPKKILLAEADFLFNHSRDCDQSLVFETIAADHSQSALLLSHAEAAKAYLNGMYTDGSTKLDSYMRKSLDHGPAESARGQIEPTDVPGQGETAEKSQSIDPSLDIADDYEMMKEKYRLWKKRMDREG